MTEPVDTPRPARPQRLHDPEPTTSPTNDIDEPEDPLAAEETWGRIGYGRFGAWSPYALAALILATIVIIAAINLRDTDDDAGDGDTAALPGETAESRGPAPAFTATLLTGDTFNLADQRGKVVVVNFWASWCEPCKQEMPALQQLAAANPDVVFIGIAAATDSPDKAAAFATEAGVTYPLAMDSGGAGPVGEIGGEFKVFGYPSTFFIDANGQIVDPVYGALPLEHLQQYIDRARAAS